MKILQICPRVPYPLHDGGAIGIFNITKQLALRGHQIKMVAFGKDDSTAWDGLRQYCDLTTVQHQTGTSRAGVLLNAARRTPYTISKYHANAMFQKLREIVEQAIFDLVHVDHLHTATYGIFLKERYGLPIVLREHNVESAVMERFAQNQNNLLLHWYARLQHQKLLRYEPEICEKFDCCVMITAEDEQRLRAMSKRARTTVIPAGVDLPVISDHAAEEPKSILFLASLDWPPNVDGFLWFYENVLPIVLPEEPNVRVTIIGKGPSPRLQQLKHPNLRFIGFVDDVVPYLRAAQACIVPLFAGGGMRIKILEMFAYRQSVISTAVGCEGLEVKNRHELLIANDATAFAQSLLAVLREPGLRASLGNNARKLVEAKYSWPQIGAAFDRVYQQCLKKNH